MNTVKWLRVSFMLMLALGLATVAFAQVRDPRLSDSQEPGSVLVFPKFIRGTHTTDSITVPRTEIEISVVCPRGATCREGDRVKLLAHWVCPGSQRFEEKFICREVNFNLFTTVFGTVTFNPNGGISPAGYPGGTGPGRVPPPPCERGYLIVWVVDTADRPIKFDGLIGDGVVRDLQGTAEAYNAIPIQAATLLPHGAPTDVNGNGALDFDGITEYQAVTGRVQAPVRFDSLTGNPPFAATSLTLLTLDVRSNRSNNPTAVDLFFFNEREELISTSWEFVCWTQIRLSDINPSLTQAGIGSRKGLVVSGPAEKVPFGGIFDIAGPVTLLGIVESAEFDGTLSGYSYSLYNDSVPVPTAFVP